MTAGNEPTWSAPVRYAEADQQGVVFNAHYLAYCDEAYTAFCRARGLVEFALLARVKSATLTWHAGLWWGDVVDVQVTCPRVGRTSASLVFELSADGRPCCTVETVYVNADRDGVPQPLPEPTRVALQT